MDISRASDSLRSQAVRYCLSAGVTCLVLFFVLLAFVVGAPNGLTIDLSAQGWVNGLRGGFLTVIFKHVCEIASPVGAALLIAVISVLLVRTHRRLVALLIGWSAMVSVFGYAIKLAVNRPRPLQSLSLIHETSPSFPSGHALMATAIGGIVAYMLVRAVSYRPARLGIAGLWVLFVLATLFGRLYLGAHYISDVTGGALLGLGLLGLLVGLNLYDRTLLPGRIFNRPVIRAVIAGLVVTVAASLILPSFFS